MWSPKVKTIRALERGLVVLRAVQEMRAVSLNDLYLRTGIAKATLLRILLTLERQGLIWQRIADGLFRPGYALHEQASTIDDIDRLVESAAPELDRLQQKILWPSDLAVRRGYSMEVCETNRAQSYFMIRRDKIGFKVNMLRSAVGRAYLAYCPDEEREEILTQLKTSGNKGDTMARSPKMIHALLEETRKLGYGTRDSSFGGDYDRPKSEYNDGLAAMAVPILTQEGTVLGCVNIVWVERLFKVSVMADKYLKDLQQTADRITRKMR